MFGQIPDFNDGLEFLRKMWGNAAGIPGMPGMPAGLMPGLQAMTPPMSLEDVDKRIHDLKAVESWLQLNTNLLRTTIQGLEVQRATLVALQTFGNALSPEAMQTAMENVARAATAPSAARRPYGQPAAGAEGIDARDIADMAEMEATPDAPPDEGTDVEAPPDEAPAGEAARDAAAGQSAASAAQAGLPPQAGLWWDMVQRQFNQIASGAAAASLASLGNLGAFGAGAAPGGNAAGTRHGAGGEAGHEAGGEAGGAEQARGEPDRTRDTGTRARQDAGAASGRNARPATKRAGARTSGQSDADRGPAGKEPGPGAGGPAGGVAGGAGSSRKGATQAPAPRPRRTRPAPKS